MKSIFKAVFILSLFNILSRVVSFIYKIYLSRIITQAELGSYSIAVSLALTFITIVNSGLPLQISKDVASYYSKDKNKVYKNTSSSLIICFLLSTIMCILILISKHLFNLILPHSDIYTLLLYLLPFIIISAIYAPFRGYLWGREKYMHSSIVEFVEQILKFAILFLILSSFNLSNYMAISIAITISCLISTLIGIYYYFKDKGKLVFKNLTYKPVIKNATPITLVRVIGSLVYPLIAIILPLLLIKNGYTSEQAMSQLGIAAGMTIPLLTIPNTFVGSLATAIIPKLTNLKSLNKHTEISSQINSSLIFTLFTTILLIPIFSSFGEQICVILFNNKTAGTFLSNYAWVLLPMSLSQITTSMINSLGYEMKTFKYFLFSGIATAICLFTLPTFIGISTIFAIMAVSAIVILILNFHLLNRHTNLNIFYKKLAIIILIELPVILFSKWTYSILSNFIPDFMNLVICCLFLTIVLISLLIAVKIIDYEYVNTKIQTIKHKKKLS